MAFQNIGNFVSSNRAPSNTGAPLRYFIHKASGNTNALNAGVSLHPRVAKKYGLVPGMMLTLDFDWEAAIARMYAVPATSSLRAYKCYSGGKSSDARLYVKWTHFEPLPKEGFDIHEYEIRDDGIYFLLDPTAQKKRDEEQAQFAWLER